VHGTVTPLCGLFGLHITTQSVLLNIYILGFLSRKRPLLLLLHQLLQAANRLIQFRLHNQRNLQFHLLDPMLIPWTCFLRLCRMLLQMLLVVKITMFCEIIHSSEPLLQELGKQNPQIMQLIQENQAEFLRLINEPAEGAEGSLLDQFADAEMPQTIAVTPEENEAIQRLEQMGFDRDLVLEVFFACNKDEQMAANYLLDHMNDFDEAQQ